MNWKLFTLSLIIFVTGSVTGAFIHHKGFSSGHNDATEAMKPIIKDAIDKETISNTIKTNIRKIKNSDTLQINVSQDPFNDLNPDNIIITKNDCFMTINEYNSLPVGKRNRIKKWFK
jgi:hypothetical protein